MPNADAKDKITTAPESRRAFLRRISGLAASAAVASAVGLPVLLLGQGPAEAKTAAASSSPAVSLRDLHLASFTPQVHTTFTIRGPHGPVTTELVDATDRSRGQGMEIFSLRFRAVKGAPMPSGTYRVEHATLGKMDLFLVPIMTSKPGMQDYEAIFNRMSAPAL